MDKYRAFSAAFAEWGVWIIIIKGLTPIPFKLVTIASGAAHFDLVSFTMASLVCRSLRFFPLAALLWRFGEPIRDFIEHRLMLVTSLVAAALVGGFVVLRYL
jgi:membrane protein YqaA with SNARE-associated domain